MDFNQYQAEAKKTAVYPDIGRNYIYPTLGLANEAGEVGGKVKKVIRDRGGIMDEVAREDIAKELGDVLWYIAQLATELGVSLEDIANHNLAKLQSRQERDQLHGSGDNR